MSDLFILQNQDNLLLGKQKDWLDGRDLAALYKTLHKDEAINQMVEVSAKDYTQRIKILTCQSNDKGLPIIDEALLPPPLPKVPKPNSRAAALALEAADKLECVEELEEELDELVFTVPEADAETDDLQTPLL